MSFRQFSLNSDVAGLVARLLLTDRRNIHFINGGSRRKEMVYAKALKRAVVKALKGRTKQEFACEVGEA